MATPSGARILAAVEGVWARIRELHPNIPDVVMTLASGSSKKGPLVFGHHAPMRWQARDGSLNFGEVMVSGEGLSRDPSAVLGTVLHEAAHAQCFALGIVDTSRQGRYHNTKFKRQAEGLGLEIVQDKRIGWSVTSVPAATVERYADALAALAEAMSVFRRPSNHAGERGAKSPSNNGVVIKCGCRQVRLSVPAYDLGLIKCMPCGDYFELKED